MATSEKRQITLEVAPEIADLYQSATDTDRYTLEFLFELYLRRSESDLKKLLAEFLLSKSRKHFFLNEDGTWNKQALDAVSDEAEANGLTPEILEEILNEE